MKMLEDKILGLDISTSITGATVIQNGKILESSFWDTRNKNRFPTIYHKAQHIKCKLEEIRNEHKFTHVYIEQSLHSFRSGFSSAQTLSTLSRFNGIVSWMCWDIFHREPQMLAATSARKSIGIKVARGENAKQKTLNFVIDSEPLFVIEYTKAGNPRPGTMDKSDSYVIAKAGHIVCSQKS